jgi:hypothetical protein
MLSVDFNLNITRDINDVEIKTKLRGETKVDEANQAGAVDDRSPHHFSARAARRKTPSPANTIVATD